MINMIGYGSLMNVESLESTVLRPVRDMHVMWLPGWNRVFDAGDGAYSYLNIRPNPLGKIQVVSFAITRAELEVLQGREASGVLTQVFPEVHPKFKDRTYWTFIWPQSQIQDGKVRPVLQSYIDVCVDGAERFGINFLKGFSHTPFKVLDDRQKPQYDVVYKPWSKVGKKAMRRLRVKRFFRLGEN